MQGVFIDGRRPRSKKEVRELVLTGDLARVELEATSWFGNEYGGPLNYAPDGAYYFVGPDPHTKRNFYGTITVKDGKVGVS